MTRCELSAAGTVQEVNNLLVLIKNTEDKIKKAKTQITEATDENTKTFLKEQRATLKEKLKIWKTRLENKEKEVGWSSDKKASLIKQGEILMTYMEVITKERVYKTLSRWQRVINVLLYIIFILNATITGFGVSGLPGYISPDPTAQAP